MELLSNPITHSSPSHHHNGRTTSNSLHGESIEGNLWYNRNNTPRGVKVEVVKEKGKHRELDEQKESEESSEAKEEWEKKYASSNDLEDSED